MLTKQQDAYGRIVWDHFHGKPTREIVERGDGCIDISGGAPHYFAEFKDRPRHHQAAMRFVHACVLDVGCGDGVVDVGRSNQGMPVYVARDAV